MKRSEGERVRLEHSLTRLSAHISSIKIGLKAGGPIGPDIAGGLVQTALEVAMQIAKFDAYELIERDIEAVEGEIARKVQQAMLTNAIPPNGRWRTLSEVSPSGKTLFVCLSCGTRSPSPTTNCNNGGVKQYDGTMRECKDWKPSPFEVQ
jgi:hypothetical protein